MYSSNTMLHGAVTAKHLLQLGMNLLNKSRILMISLLPNLMLLPTKLLDLTSVDTQLLSIIQRTTNPDLTTVVIVNLKISRSSSVRTHPPTKLPDKVRLQKVERSRKNC